MKEIRVFLTDNDLYDFIDKCDEMPKIAYTLEAFKRELACSDKIYTTVLEAVDSKYYSYGFDIIVVSDGDEIQFSKLIKYGNYDGREIRIEHDWRKMLINGVFNLNTNFEFCSPIPGIVYRRGKDGWTSGIDN